ncbi:DNA polymerase III subunit gamma/tau [Pseudoflavonifractor capillosus]|uniref:DNA-directed DNA polymerase n=1 Tax=Pseudoflavonifractor capillosus TaxID=106588 RepID=A0A921ML92_9FIRM|nr:DNA polymerase III subunit gamma/tau [Pseudoflavonifractor capillosus]HJG86459.1 DNA polymerase III subunit gamma/tau [Pseudoflavonifractor capillosus]
MYQALYRKWRPRSFDDVVGQSHITDTLKRQVATGRLSHAYLFTGTRGTGKTTCAKILARAVNCEHPVDGNPCNQCSSCLGIENGSILDVLELDAASNNGVDQVRALRDEAVYTPAAVRKRVYIVDEVHMLSTAAFNALLKILEEPPEHLMFILATTELHKVPATIKSRCQQFAFKRILPGDIARRLSYVAEQEGIGLTAEGAALLARLADGGLRDALSLLDQCVNPAGAIGEAEVLSALGLAGNLETAALMEQIAKGETAGAMETLARLYGAGKDVGSLLGELSALARDLLIRKTAPQSGAALLTGGYDETTLRRLDRLLTPARLAQILSQLQAVSADLSRSGNRRTDAELCLIRLCDETLDLSPAGLNARLTRLEERLAGGTVPVQPAQGVPVQQTAAPAVPQPEQEAPARSENRPPWEEERPPLPEEPGERVNPAAEVEPAAPAVQLRQSAPARPGPAQEAPAARQTAPAGDFWPELAASLKGRIPMGEYTFLANPAMVQGRAEGNMLTLYAESDFTRSMINKPGILSVVAQAASARLGGQMRVTVTVGQAPPAASAPAAPAADPPAHDKLDDLLAFGQQFDNIIIK